MKEKRRIEKEQLRQSKRSPSPPAARNESPPAARKKSPPAARNESPPAARNKSPPASSGQLKIPTEVFRKSIRKIQNKLQNKEPGIGVQATKDDLLLPRKPRQLPSFKKLVEKNILQKSARPRSTSTARPRSASPPELEYRPNTAKTTGINPMMYSPILENLRKQREIQELEQLQNALEKQERRKKKEQELLNNLLRRTPSQKNRMRK
jgi:hypothetical protein